MTDEAFDIGKAASQARTALTDSLFVRTITSKELNYAVGKLDQIINCTDPVDDERFLERCAQSVNALGRALEHIRDEVEKYAMLRSVQADRLLLTAFDTSIADALDLVDAGVSRLMEAYETDREPYYEMPVDNVSGTVFDPTDHTFGPILAALQAGEFEEAARLTSVLASQTPERGD